MAPASLPDGVVRVFAGESIPGIVAVVGSDYEKAGKWSHTTFRLELAPGVRAVPGRDGWETGTLREALGADRWVDAANALGASVAQVQAFVRAWRPKAAEHWDRVEAELEAVDAEVPDEGAATATLSFGSPTNRVAREGFWDWPVRVLDAAGCEVGRVVPSWSSPTTAGTVRVLTCDHSSGMHGGSYSIRCAIPEGCTLAHGPDPAVPPRETEEHAAAREWVAIALPVLGRERLLALLSDAQEGTGAARMAFDAAIWAAGVPAETPRLGGQKGVPTFCDAARIAEEVVAVTVQGPTPMPPATLDGLRARFGGAR